MRQRGGFHQDLCVSFLALPEYLTYLSKFSIF